MSPLYEFRCAECGFKFEARQPLEAKPIAQCPKCGEDAQRHFPLVNHTFGWRLTESSHIKGNPDRVERAI